MKKIFFHGFGSDESQFADFADENSWLFPINKYICDELDSIIRTIESFIGNEPAQLIGYSFGARLAMQIFCQNPTRFTHIILLAGHAGLASIEEKKQRLIIEESFLEKLSQKSMQEFELYWNELDLFSHDQFEKLKTTDKEILKQYFLSWGLSKQPFMLNDLKKFKDKVLWFYGEFDEKYCHYANNELSDFNVIKIPSQGHRVYQSKAMQKMLKEILCN